MLLRELLDLVPHLDADTSPDLFRLADRVSPSRVSTPGHGAGSCRSVSRQPHGHAAASPDLCQEVFGSDLVHELRAGENKALRAARVLDAVDDGSTRDDQERGPNRHSKTVGVFLACGSSLDAVDRVGAFARHALDLTQFGSLRNEPAGTRPRLHQALTDKLIHCGPDGPPSYTKSLCEYAR